VPRFRHGDLTHNWVAYRPRLLFAVFRFKEKTGPRHIRRTLKFACRSENWFHSTRTPGLFDIFTQNAGSRFIVFIELDHCERSEHSYETFLDEIWARYLTASSIRRCSRPWSKWGRGVPPIRGSGLHVIQFCRQDIMSDITHLNRRFILLRQTYCGGNLSRTKPSGNSLSPYENSSFSRLRREKKSRQIDAHFPPSISNEFERTVIQNKCLDLQTSVFEWNLDLKNPEIQIHFVIRSSIDLAAIWVLSSLGAFLRVYGSTISNPSPHCVFRGRSLPHRNTLIMNRWRLQQTFKEKYFCSSYSRWCTRSSYACVNCRCQVSTYSFVVTGIL
jgi:hypothetical protein